MQESVESALKPMARTPCAEKLLSAARVVMVFFRKRILLDQHGKLLLMAPSKDRAGTLGFHSVM